jgi:hypothetical protein
MRALASFGIGLALRTSTVAVGSHLGFDHQDEIIKSPLLCLEQMLEEDRDAANYSTLTYR